MFDLSRLRDPRFLVGSPPVSYRDPAVLLADGDPRNWSSPGTMWCGTPTSG